MSSATIRSATTRAPRTPAGPPAAKRDLRKELAPLYAPSARDVAFVDVPPLRYLMIDGEGDPNRTPAYGEAVAALFGAAYRLKFAMKKRSGADWGVMPLEGLWSADDPRDFLDRPGGRDRWRRTLMVLQPDVVTPELLDELRPSLAAHAAASAVARLRVETLDEGPVAQILHVGPYCDEGPTVARLHAAIAARGAALRGRHHEIYLGDPRRTAPAALKTILRQPMG